MVFLWSLSDRKSSLVSRTLLSILSILSNVVVWIVSTRPPTFKSSSLFSNSFSYSSIRTIYNCHLHVPYFFQFPSKVEVLILLFTFFQFYSVVSRDSKVDNFAVLFFCWLLLGLVFWPRLGDTCVYQSPIGVYVCHFIGQVLGCAYIICL